MAHGSTRSGFTFICRNRAVMPVTKRRRMYRSPIFVIRPSRSFPPLDKFRGVRPNQAANCRPFLNCFASPTVATMADAVTGPTPGIVRNNMTRLSSFECSRMRISYQRKRRCIATSWWLSCLRTSIAISGKAGFSPSRTPFAYLTAAPVPCGMMTPNSASRLRSMLLSCVRCLTIKSRARCRNSTACCSSDLGATNRIVGRVTASQIASASLTPNEAYDSKTEPMRLAA